MGYIQGPQGTWMHVHIHVWDVILTEQQCLQSMGSHRHKREQEHKETTNHKASTIQSKQNGSLKINDACENRVSTLRDSRNNLKKLQWQYNHIWWRAREDRMMGTCKCFLLNDVSTFWIWPVTCYLHHVKTRQLAKVHVTYRAKFPKTMFPPIAW